MRGEVGAQVGAVQVGDHPARKVEQERDEVRVARPVVAGTVIPYKVPDMFGRPWAKIWEEYHEKGMQRPPEKELITFD